MKERTLDTGIYERTGPNGTTYMVRMRRQQKRIAQTFNTLSEARLFRAKVLADTALHPQAADVLTQKAQHLADKMPLSDLIKWYEKAETSLKKGAAAETTRLNKLRRQPIAKLSVSRVRPEDVLQLMRDLKSGGLKDSSVYKYFTLLNDMFRRGAVKKIIPHRNPLDAVDRDDLHGLLPAWKGVERTRRLVGDEEARLIDALSRSRNPQLLFFLLLSIATGCRRSELLDARWEDYHPARGLLLRPRKGHATPQAIPLSDYAVRVIESLKDPPAPKYQRKARPIDKERIFALLSNHQLRSGWESACKRAGITDLRWHDSRHEMLSRMFEAGFNIKEAQMVSGHKTVQSLMRYVNPHEQDIKDKLNKLKI